MSPLDNSSIVVQRQLEMMNVLMGFEQANRYVIMGPHGIGSAFTRQMFRTHRSFTTHVFDRNEREVLRVRSFWFDHEFIICNTRSYTDLAY